MWSAAGRRGQINMAAAAGRRRRRREAERGEVASSSGTKRRSSPPLRSTPQHAHTHTAIITIRIRSQHSTRCPLAPNSSLGSRFQARSLTLSPGPSLLARIRLGAPTASNTDAEHARSVTTRGGPCPRASARAPTTGGGGGQRVGGIARASSAAGGGSGTLDNTGPTPPSATRPGRRVRAHTQLSLTGGERSRRRNRNGGAAAAGRRRRRRRSCPDQVGARHHPGVQGERGEGPRQHREECACKDWKAAGL